MHSSANASPARSPPSPSPPAASPPPPPPTTSGLTSSISSGSQHNSADTHGNTDRHRTSKRAFERLPALLFFVLRPSSDNHALSGPGSDPPPAYPPANP